MPAAKVRTTIALRRELLEAIDAAVKAGLARSRNELCAAALENQLAAWRRKSIDDAFAGMAEDPIYQLEALEIAEEFGTSDWESFQLAEGKDR